MRVPPPQKNLNFVGNLLEILGSFYSLPPNKILTPNIQHIHRLGSATYSFLASLYGYEMLLCLWPSSSCYYFLLKVSNCTTFNWPEPRLCKLQMFGSAVLFLFSAGPQRTGYMISVQNKCIHLYESATADLSPMKLRVVESFLPTSNQDPHWLNKTREEPESCFTLIFGNCLDREEHQVRLHHSGSHVL